LFTTKDFTAQQQVVRGQPLFIVKFGLLLNLSNDRACPLAIFGRDLESSRPKNAMAHPMDPAKKSALKWTVAMLACWGLLGLLQSKLHGVGSTLSVQEAAFLKAYVLFFPAACVGIILTFVVAMKWFPVVRHWQKEKLLRLEKESAKRRQRGSQDQ
jgi:hypothetical protein